MRWIVLKNTGIDGLNLISMPYVCKSLYAMEIISAPNPWNDDRIFHYVRETEKPKTLLTIRHRCFPISCRKDLYQEFMDVLDEECEKASLLEREELCERINAINCPYFDRRKNDLLHYLAR